MEHKYRVGQDVYYKPPIKHTAALGTYKITARLPVEIEGQHQDAGKRDRLARSW